MPESDLPLKVAVLETRVAGHDVLLDRILKSQEMIAADVHAIRETIATAKGGWWVGATLVGILAAIAGGAGALVHKLVS